MGNKFRIVLLASGTGTIAQSVIDACEQGILKIEIAGLISDKHCPAIERANKHGIPSFHIPLKDPRADWDYELYLKTNQLKPDLVVGVGFMRILSKQFIGTFKVINSHPSLLPDFPGSHAVRDCLAAGAKKTGCTVHWVDETVDTGEIITQSQVVINLNDTEQSLHERIKVEECRLIVEVLRKLSSSY